MSANLVEPGVVYPLQQPPDTATELQAWSFLIDAILSHVRTAHPVQVVAVYPGAGSPPLPGTVDVKPLVSQMNGIGQGQAHGTVYGRPFVRIQSGGSAVIVDPNVGDRGVLLCCDRDISNVVATLAAALPASLRRFNFADGIYIGGWGNGTAATDYVWVKPASAGIAMVSLGPIDIQGSQVNITGPINANGAQISGAGEIQDAAGVVLGTHEHGPGTYVAPGGGGAITGDSGEPT